MLIVSEQLFLGTFLHSSTGPKTGYLEHFFSNFQKLFVVTECMSPGCQVQPNKIYFSRNRYVQYKRFSLIKTPLSSAGKKIILIQIVAVHQPCTQTSNSDNSTTNRWIFLFQLRCVDHTLIRLHKNYCTRSFHFHMLMILPITTTPFSKILCTQTSNSNKSTTAKQIFNLSTTLYRSYSN